MYINLKDVCCSQEIAEATAKALAAAEEEGEVAGAGEDGGEKNTLGVVQTGDLTEDEEKALFTMIDEDVGGTLNHADFLNLPDAIGFALSDDAIETAMIEIATFPKAETLLDEDEEAKAIRIATMREREEVRFVLFVYCFETVLKLFLYCFVLKMTSLIGERQDAGVRAGRRLDITDEQSAAGANYSTMMNLACI